MLYRPPNIRAVSDAVLKIRAGCMGTLVPSSFDAPMRLARALERGGSVGMLVDQHDQRGVDVTFFGRTCKAVPLRRNWPAISTARSKACAWCAGRTGNTFWGEITEPIELLRDAEGKIDVAGTMQAIASVIEAWVREHPDQWLWLHRRWR